MTIKGVYNLLCDEYPCDIMILCNNYLDPFCDACGCQEKDAKLCHSKFCEMCFCDAWSFCHNYIFTHLCVSRFF